MDAVSGRRETLMRQVYVDWGWQIDVCKNDQKRRKILKDTPISSNGCSSTFEVSSIRAQVVAVWVLDWLVQLAFLGSCSWQRQVRYLGNTNPR